MSNALLENGLKELELDFSREQLGQLEAYLEELMLFNPTYRLVSNSDREEIIIRHILDSAAGAKYFADDDKKTEILDLGTGAGFPGLVLSILIKEKSFTLCDRMTRRVNFLRSTVLKLGIRNVEILEKSAEDIEKHYDIVTSRAFHKLSDSYHFMRPLLKEDGVIILYKGMRKNISEELLELRKAGYNPPYDILKLKVPYLDEERNLLYLR